MGELIRILCEYDITFNILTKSNDDFRPPNILEAWKSRIAGSNDFEDTSEISGLRVSWLISSQLLKIIYGH